MQVSRRSVLGTALGAAGGLALGGPASARPAATGVARGVLRTPEERFAGLDGYAFRPRYVPVGRAPRLRLHYLDEGPRDGETVLLLHGEPSWSYLYRRVIPPLVAAGHRCVVPDLIGFGRSDKPAAPAAYTYQRHLDWLREAVFARLGLCDVTMVCHDWGGLLGLRLLAEHPRRFRRVLATNTHLPTGDQDLGEAFRRWLEYSQTVETFDVGAIVDNGTLADLAPAVRAAYDAPYPDESYKVAARRFPALVPITPDDPAAEPNRRAWRVLERLHTPFLTAFSDEDWAFGGPAGARSLYERIPGAVGQPHTVITGAGHFVQEDQAAVLTEVVLDFIDRTRTVRL